MKRIFPFFTFYYDNNNRLHLRPIDCLNDYFFISLLLIFFISHCLNPKTKKQTRTDERLKASEMNMRKRTQNSISKSGQALYLSASTAIDKV